MNVGPRLRDIAELFDHRSIERRLQYLRESVEMPHVSASSSCALARVIGMLRMFFNTKEVIRCQSYRKTAKIDDWSGGCLGSSSSPPLRDRLNRVSDSSERAVIGSRLDQISANVG